MGSAWRIARDPLALCRREKVALSLVGTGATNEEIAAQMGISRHTVRIYVKRLHDKLDIQGRSRLAIYAHDLYRDKGQD